MTRAGIPAPSSKELMAAELVADADGDSHMGAHYRHTTPEMAARAVDAIEQRLTVVLQVGQQTIEKHPNRSTLRVF
jgi:hypothetical protein